MIRQGSPELVEGLNQRFFNKQSQDDNGTKTNQLDQVLAAKFFK